MMHKFFDFECIFCRNDQWCLECELHFCRETKYGGPFPLCAHNQCCAVSCVKMSSSILILFIAMRSHEYHGAQITGNGTNFSEILIESHTFLFKKMYLEILSGKWRPFCSASMCYRCGPQNGGEFCSCLSIMWSPAVSPAPCKYILETETILRNTENWLQRKLSKHNFGIYLQLWYCVTNGAVTFPECFAKYLYIYGL